MSHYTIINKTETATAYISLSDDDIVRVVYKSKVEVTAEELAVNFLAYNEMVQGKSYPFIFTAEDETIYYSPEARKYSKEREHDFPKVCIALCGTQLALRLVANFYLRFEKPFYPTKIFEKVEQAEAWCKEQQLKYNSH